MPLSAVHSHESPGSWFLNLHPALLSPRHTKSWHGSEGHHLHHMSGLRGQTVFLSQGKKLFWLNLLNEEMKLHTCSISWTLGNLWQKDRHIFLKIWYYFREPDSSFSSVSRALAHTGNCALFHTFSIQQLQFLSS